MPYLFRLVALESTSSTGFGGFGSCSNFHSLDLRSSGGRWTLAGSICFSSRWRLWAWRRAAKLAGDGEDKIPVCVLCNLYYAQGFSCKIGLYCA